jgi:hypothetical protein
MSFLHIQSRSLTLFFLLATLASLPFSTLRLVLFGIPLYLPECLTLAAGGHVAWRWYRKDMSLVPTSAAVVWSVAFLGIGVVSSTIVNGVSATALGIVKSWFIFPILFAWLLFQTLSSTIMTVDTDRFDKENTVLLTWYSTIVSVAVAAWYSLLADDLTYDGRLKAFYLSPNHLALWLFPGVFLGWYWLTRSHAAHSFPAKMSRMLPFFSWALVCAAVFATKSYTVIGACLGVFGFFRFSDTALARKQKLRVLLGTAFVGIYFVVSQAHTEKFIDLTHLDERSSIASRGMIWQASVAMILDHPLFGIGPGNFQDVYLEYQRFFPPYLEWAVPHPHQLYLAFWLSSGIVGLIGFLALLVFWFRALSSDTFFPENDEYAARSARKTLLAIVIAFLCIGLFETPYWKTDLAYAFWLPIAIGSAITNRCRKACHRCD